MVFPFWVCCYTSPRPELNSCVASSTTPLSVVRTSLEAVPKTASCAPGGHPCRKAVFLAFPLMLDSATMLLYDQMVGFLGQTESPGFLPSPLWSSSLLRADASSGPSPRPQPASTSWHFEGGSFLGVPTPLDVFPQGSGLEGAICKLGTWTDDIGLWVCVTMNSGGFPSMWSSESSLTCLLPEDGGGWSREGQC